MLPQLLSLTSSAAESSGFRLFRAEPGDEPNGTHRIGKNIETGSRKMWLHEFRPSLDSESNDDSVTLEVVEQEPRKSPSKLSTVKTIAEASTNPERFRLLQKFEGVVIDRLSNSFIARLTDSRAGSEEEAEIDFEEITDADIPLIERGAVFYWSLGYEEKVYGQRTRVSIIRFRRLPPISAEDISSARTRALFLRSVLKFDERLESAPL